MTFLAFESTPGILVPRPDMLVMSKCNASATRSVVTASSLHGDSGVGVSVDQPSHARRIPMRSGRPALARPVVFPGERRNGDPLIQPHQGIPDREGGIIKLGRPCVVRRRVW